MKIQQGRVTRKAFANWFLDHSINEPADRSISIYVALRGFASPPHIMLSLTGFEHNSNTSVVDDNLRIDATKITASGFILSVSVSHFSRLNDVSIDWTAIGK